MWILIKLRSLALIYLGKIFSSSLSTHSYRFGSFRDDPSLSILRSEKKNLKKYFIDRFLLSSRVAQIQVFWLFMFWNLLRRSSFKCFSIDLSATTDWLELGSRSQSTAQLTIPCLLTTREMFTIKRLPQQRGSWWSYNRVGLFSSAPRARARLCWSRIMNENTNSLDFSVLY